MKIKLACDGSEGFSLIHDNTELSAREVKARKLFYSIAKLNGSFEEQKRNGELIVNAVNGCPLPDAPEPSKWLDKPDLSAPFWVFRKSKYAPPQIFEVSKDYADKPAILRTIGSQQIIYLDNLPEYYKTGKWQKAIIPTLPEEKQ